MSVLIDVIAPASAAPVFKLNKALDWLELNEFEANLPSDLLKPKLFFASSLENQVKHIKSAIYSSSEFLWCLRGGYGSARLIPYLEKLKKPKTKKVLVGFSDITALHLFFIQKWGWKTIHGRVLSQMDPQNPKKDYAQYKSLFERSLKHVQYNQLKCLNVAAKSKNLIKGKIIGGNLRILETSIGTKWQLNADNKILFLEDVGERGYSIHRMLLHLEQAGVINKKIKAVLLGSFSEGEEKDGSDRTQEALISYFKNSGIPVYKNTPCGHGEENFILPLNSPAEITVNKSKVSLKIKL
jgi:muramoyltetrapeptide carboxypeptidase